MYPSGGGIITTGLLTLVNSTVSGNSGGEGGGIASFGGTVTLTNSTITGNKATNGGGLGGGGILLNTGVVTVKNTIIANNTAVPSGANCGGAPSSQGHNLESANTCGFTGPSDLVNTDPKLGPLRDSGGPRWSSRQSFCS